MYAFYTVILIMVPVDIITHPPVTQGMVIFLIILQDPLGDRLVFQFLCRRCPVQPFIIRSPGNVQPSAQLPDAGALAGIVAILFMDFLDGNEFRL